MIVLMVNLLSYKSSVELQYEIQNKGQKIFHLVRYTLYYDNMKNIYSILGAKKYTFFLYKKMSLKIDKILRKSPVSDFLYQIIWITYL